MQGALSNILEEEEGARAGGSRDRRHRRLWHRGGLAPGRSDADARAGRSRTPHTPRTRRAIGVCASRPGHSAENTLARTAQAHYKRAREGKRDKARETALAALSSV